MVSFKCWTDTGYLPATNCCFLDGLHKTSSTDWHPWITTSKPSDDLRSALRLAATFRLSPNHDWCPESTAVGRSHACLNQSIFKTDLISKEWKYASLCTLSLSDVMRLNLSLDLEKADYPLSSSEGKRGKRNDRQVPTSSAGLGASLRLASSL